MQMGRSAGFNLGATYSSHRPQQQQQHTPSASGSGGPFSNINNQDLLYVHGSEMFPSPPSNYHSQVCLGHTPKLFFNSIVIIIFEARWNLTFQIKKEKVTGIDKPQKITLHCYPLLSHALYFILCLSTYFISPVPFLFIHGDNRISFAL